MRIGVREQQFLVALRGIRTAAGECPDERREYGRRTAREVFRERLTDEAGCGSALTLRPQLKVPLESFRHKDGRPFHMYMMAYISVPTFASPRTDRAPDVSHDENLARGTQPQP
jgi:hypothetical protein